ncbi:MAG: pyridoxamine 5'-phosphate oxidase [Nocardioides sp.]
MSKLVELADLGAALGEYGTGYLLTQSIRGGTKAVGVAPVYDDSAGPRFAVIDPGRGSCENVAANPGVTLLFPPLSQPGFTLIVDGEASVGSGDPAGITVTVTHALLHRPPG